MKTKITLLCLLAFLCLIPKVSAQCTTGIKNPAGIYQATENAFAGIINTDARVGEYADVHIVPLKRYQFDTSVSTDYITITNDSGTQVLAHGPSPLAYVSVYNQVIRYYIHQNAQCQAPLLAARTRYISWVVAPPCNDPSNLAVTDITSNSCKIIWTPPAGVAPYFGYDVHVSTSPDTPGDQSVVGSASSNFKIWSQDMNPDTTYYFWVRSDCLYQKGPWIAGGSFSTISSLACNGAKKGLFPSATFTPSCTGNQEVISYDCRTGEYSNVAVVPNTQYTFESGLGYDFITITNALGTAIHASGTTPVTWNSGSTSGVVRFYLNTNSQCGVDASGSTRGRFVKCITTSTTCLPPSNLTVSNITSNSCRLTWNAPSSTPGAGYDIYLTTSNTAPGVTTTATHTSTTAGIKVITGLTAGFTYNYWIRSNCGSEKSTWASGGSFTILDPLVCNGAIYGLYPDATITPTCTSNPEAIATDCWAGQYSNVSVAANKQYTFSSSVATDYITITNTLGTTVLASGLTPLTWTSGSASTVVRFHLNTNVNCGGQNTNRTRFVQCAGSASSCGLPTALTASNITSNSCQLAWTAPATAPNSYDVYVNQTNTAPTANTAPLGNNTNPGVLFGGIPATTYYFWIRSVCGSTRSNWVSGGSFTTLAALSCNGADYGLYPATTFTPACTGNTEQIVADAWAGEYSNVNVMANKQYTFTSSIATDYLTITNATGTAVLASGVTPLIWTSGSTAGVVRYHLNTNANCGTQEAVRTRSIKCVDAPAGNCGLPTALSVANITSNSCRLIWNAPASAPTSYDLYLIETNTPPVATTTPTGSTANAGIGILGNLTANTTYFYWIRSVCGTAKSAWVSGGSFATIAALNCNGAVHGLYPVNTFTPACTGSTEQIVADAWAGEYSNVNVVANRQYTFTSSVATDYLTITNATGTVVLASGVTPLNWASGSTSGVVRYHLNTNANCGTQQAGRVRSIKCTDVTPSCSVPTELAVSNITSDSFRITWLNASPVPSAGYDLYVVPSGTAPTANTTPTHTNFFENAWVLGGFNPATNYNYWVRANCGSTKSAWAYGGSFDTLPALNCNGAPYGLNPEDSMQIACNGTNEVVSDQAMAGEYSNIYINFEQQYTFTSSVATDYITITDEFGTQVYASGLTPLTWSSGNNVGVIRYYLHTNAACGEQAQPTRVKYIKCATLDIDENSADSQLKMYPNPSAGQFTIETGNYIADSIAVLDNLGRIITNHKPNSNTTTLTLDGVSEGVYHVKINYQAKHVTRKLVLKKS